MRANLIKSPSMTVKDQSDIEPESNGDSSDVMASPTEF